MKEAEFVGYEIIKRQIEEDKFEYKNLSENEKNDKEMLLEIISMLRTRYIHIVADSIKQEREKHQLKQLIIQIVKDKCIICNEYNKWVDKVNQCKYNKRQEKNEEAKI